MSILIGTTLTTYAMDSLDTWESWLRNASAVRGWLPGVRVDYFAAIETDGRDLHPFRALLQRLVQLHQPDAPTEPWVEFQLRDERETVTQANRLPHITMGQNLVTDRAVRDTECTHLLFMAADCQPPDAILPRLLELDHPYCGPVIPTYGDALRGNPFSIPVMREGGWQAAPCEYGMPSAACVLIERRVFNRLRWRWDPVAGLSDDPAYQRDARELLGVNSIVRTDLEARHFPESIGPVETRGADMRVVR